MHLKKNNENSRLGNYSYEPLIFSTSLTIKTAERVCASYVGDILSDVQGKRVKNATIISIDGRVRTIKLSFDKYIPILNELTKWCVSKSEPPAVIINKHCPLCRFEKKCLLEAKKMDSIVLAFAL